ncbi:PREDICTED: GDSL esterase/lipase At1g09390-like [Nelumbo nucifera]|uniref:GDSL esterase/lipase At1g09390-like n=1 Tax=Nelumbo nucifera TaxID=4432 RepID=A0A1U8AWA6_NELNU|nr:PREDICTED: GDSL esterase/lipase At1g09390-like [Nelumbo nucifera]
MGHKGGASLLLHQYLIFLSFPVIFLPLFAHSQCNGRNPVVLNFGDSNSDTGGFAVGLGLPIRPPNGRTFFHGSSNRLSDGRLVIDFLCESLNMSYLTPYLESLEPNFRNGANFAISGSSTLPKFVPFSLDIQVLQFLRFQARSLQLLSQGSRGLVDEEGFRNALYTLDIGQNDLVASFTYLSYAEIIKRIPSFLEEIKSAIWSIYLHGGKNFWIHNTGPLGCLPQMLSITSRNVSGLDPYGCLQSPNDAAKVFNEGLRALCEELRSQMKNATIVYVDIYSIKYDLIANSTKYGFQHPLMVCCGYGGPPYNFNPNVTCGQTGYNICEEGSKYISWDGTHYTEAANEIVASKILSANYSIPNLKFDYFCHTS